MLLALSTSQLVQFAAGSTSVGLHACHLPALRHGLSPQCLAGANDESSDGTRQRIDYQQIEQELADLRSETTATPEEIASHLPSWAAEIMLTPDLNEEYETSQATQRAASLHAQRVDGRTWEESDGADDAWGMGQFTAEELAEDYNLPLEAVVEAILSAGVDRQRFKLRRPVKEVCSSTQLTELLGFLGTADPIALNDELCDSTLSDIADDSLLTAEQLIQLCARNEISVVLGEDTRVRQKELPTLLEAITREEAFMGRE